MIERVYLYSNHHLVKEVELPPSNKKPRVIVWGDRYFVLSFVNGLPTDDYEEVFPYMIPEGPDE